VEIFKADCPRRWKRRPSAEALRRGSWILTSSATRCALA